LLLLRTPVGRRIALSASSAASSCGCGVSACAFACGCSSSESRSSSSAAFLAATAFPLRLGRARRRLGSRRLGAVGGRHRRICIRILVVFVLLRCLREFGQLLQCAEQIGRLNTQQQTVTAHRIDSR